MEKMNKIMGSVGVWNCLDTFPSFSRNKMTDCKNNVPHSPKKRARVCMHSNPDDSFQEMFIAFSGKSYVQPSFHLKDESFHVMEGFGKYLFFNMEGDFTHDVRLGPYHSHLPFYCRIPANQSHSLVLYTQTAFAYEIVSGPFIRSNTIFPSWSLDLQTEKEQDNFRYEFSIAPVSPLPLCQFDRINEMTFQIKSKIAAIGKADLHHLKQHAKPHICLLVNSNDTSELHEVFMIYTDQAYVRPKMYADQDKSFHILEGNVDCIIFDDRGNPTDVFPLGDQASNLDFHIRIPKGVFHSIRIRSKDVILRETTLSGQKAIWAPWSPVESDIASVCQFDKKIESYITYE